MYKWVIRSKNNNTNNNTNANLSKKKNKKKKEEKCSDNLWRMICLALLQCTPAAMRAIHAAYLTPGH